MKILIIGVFISLCCNVCAQKSIFVRVYDSAGKKISKGHVVGVTDTSLQLEGKAAPVDIPLERIGVIKTRRSPGNNVLTGSIIGASTVAVLGVATADPDAFFGYTAIEGAGAGALLGLPVGAALGGLTILFKNSKTFLINGDAIKWKEFQSLIAEKKQ